ncbi:MAG: hypothetical protein DMF50_06730 [Acidobacteria bacterium]|nr:MAG: hypothetical protein DMF50_06730 [Acidobacteriota bacterium]
MARLRGRGRWLVIRALVRLTLLLTATTRVNGAVADQAPGSIGGRVTAGLSGAPLAGARVTLLPDRAGDDMVAAASYDGRMAGGGERTTLTDPGGLFLFESVAPGAYFLLLRREGFAQATLRGVRVGASSATRVDPDLAPALTVRITVPADSAAPDGLGPSRSLFPRASLVARPAALGDPFRALAGAAGMESQNDFQSQVRIRGGEASDTAVLLDGQPLPSAFHFSGGAGSAAALNGDLVESAGVSTGGFSAEYGDALAGVIDLATRDDHPERLRGRAGLSSLQASAALSGPAGGGSWVLSGRQADLGLYDRSVGENGVDGVTFHDLFAGLRLPLPHDARLAFDLLQDGNDFRQSLAPGATGEMHGVQRGARVRYEAPLSARAWVKVLLSQGDLSAHAAVTAGASYDQDRRQQAMKLSYVLQAGAHRLSAGVELSRTLGGIAGTVAEGYALVPRATTDRSLTQGVFVEDRCEPGGRLALRLGARADRSTATGGPALSPRLGLEIGPFRSVLIRAAAGRFVQFPRPEQEFLAAGEPLRRQVADHLILGVEAGLPAGARLVVEGYLKTMRDPIGESVNRYMELPDLMTRFDAGRVHGLDVTFESRAPGPWRFRLDYSYMVASEEKGGAVFPRNTDQRHTAGLSLARGLAGGWDLSGLLRYGSGLPYTSQQPWTNGIDYGLRLGALNDARLPAYARLDLRAGRTTARSWGRLSWHLDLLNVTGRRNVRDVEVYFDARKSAFFRDTSFQSPFLPVFGLTAEF